MPPLVQPNQMCLPPQLLFPPHSGGSSSVQPPCVQSIQPPGCGWCPPLPRIAKKIKAHLLQWPRMLSGRAGAQVWHMGHEARVDEGLLTWGCVFMFHPSVEVVAGYLHRWENKADGAGESPSCLKKVLTWHGYKTPKDLLPCKPGRRPKMGDSPAPSLGCMYSTLDPFSDPPLPISPPSSMERYDPNDLENRRTMSEFLFKGFSLKM